MKNKIVYNIMLIVMLSLLSTMTTFAATLPTYENKATADTVTIDNKFVDSVTTSGAITIKASTFASGDTVTIVDAKKAKLGEVIIENAANDYTVNVTLTKKSGSVGIYVTPKSTEYKVSKTNTIKYLAQKSPVADAANISITGDADKDDILTMSGVEQGDMVTIYKATATDQDKPIAKGISKGTSVEVKLGKNTICVETGIKVSITKKDCLESEKILLNGTALNYTAPPVTADMTKVFVINSAALVSGLSAKDIINVYSGDPTQYLSKYPSASDKAALKAMLLGTKTVSAKGSYVFITFKKGLEDNATVYVTRKSTGKSIITEKKTIIAGGNSSTPTDPVETMIPTAQFVIPDTQKSVPPDLAITYHLSNGVFNPNTATDVTKWKVTRNGSNEIVNSVSLSDGDKTAFVVISCAGVEVHNATILPDASVFASGTAPTEPVVVQIIAIPIVPAITGVSLVDAPGNVTNDYDGEGILKNLPTLSPGNSYKYSVEPTLDGIYQFKLPKLGEQILGSVLLTVDQSTNIVDLQRAANVSLTISNVNGCYLLLSEVDKNNRLVKYKTIKIEGITNYQGSTHGTLTGTVAVTDQTVTNLNGNPDDTKTFTITVDGVAYPITITFQDYSRGILAMRLESAGNLSVHYDSNNHIVLSSGSYGPESTVSVSGEGAELIFGTNPTIVNGKDIG